MENPIKEIEEKLGIVAGVEIRSPDRKRNGKLIPGKVEPHQFAEIVKNKYILLFGLSNATGMPQKFERLFKIGDVAEYDSYNLHYLGTIVSISDKCVGIKDKHEKKVHRLSIHEFNWRNRNLDVAATEKRNDQEMQCI